MSSFRSVSGEAVGPGLVPLLPLSLLCDVKQLTEPFVLTSHCGGAARTVERV